MPVSFKILITDRNPHVRNFLRRELNQEGYIVEVANDGRDLLRRINQEGPPDLLILDLELPYVGGLVVLKRLQDWYPRLPVIIHAFLTEEASHPAVQSAAAFVTKMGNTDCLKAVITDVLRKGYPHRFAAGGDPELEKRPPCNGNA